MEQEKVSQLIELENKKSAIESIIEKVEQPYKNILYFKYIKDFTLEVIAEKIGYNYRYTCKLHQKALQLYKQNKEIKKDI